MEGQLAGTRRELQTKEKILTNKEAIIVRKEQRLKEHEDEAVMDYMRETVGEEFGKLPTTTRFPEIQELLDDARSALNSGNTDKAVRLASEIDLLIDRLKELEEKRRFMYDLLELKTDIKLASLAE